jgi:hypothetical protein
VAKLFFTWIKLDSSGFLVPIIAASFFPSLCLCVLWLINFYRLAWISLDSREFPAFRFPLSRFYLCVFAPSLFNFRLFCFSPHSRSRPRKPDQMTAYAPAAVRFPLSAFSLSRFNLRFASSRLRCSISVPVRLNLRSSAKSADNPNLPGARVCDPQPPTPDQGPNHPID